jgi:hypothetical protein
MPEIMQTNFKDEASHDFLNVSASVGKGGVNLCGDVLLVQAFFCEVLPYLYGIPSEKIPYPTGNYDKNTAYLILKYQEMSTTVRHVKVWKDGLINRATGSTVPGKKRVWTITYLNEDLYYLHVSRGYEGDYVSWLIGKYSELSYYAASQVGSA